MSDKSEIEAIRARDAKAWIPWPRTGAYGLGATCRHGDHPCDCKQGCDPVECETDRRTLLAHIDALEARVARANELLRLCKQSGYFTNQHLVDAYLADAALAEGKP